MSVTPSNVDALILRPLKSDDADMIRQVYQDGIDTGNATFTHEAPDWEKWDNSHLPVCRVGAFHNNRMVGWAALSAVSQRIDYRGVAELSVYVSTASQGMGIGSALMTELVNESEKEGFWTLQAAIFPENPTSIALHKKYGFYQVGTRRKIALMSYGPMRGIWRDVVLMERRSQVIGVPNATNAIA